MPDRTTTTHDVDALAEQLFGAEATAVVRILGEYGREPFHQEHDRVRRAVLRLSEGDLGRLRHYLDAALVDYRDVLWWAEYGGR